MRYSRLLTFVILLSLAGSAEEITLKDGSKISGKIVGANEKVFEVDSNYGHLQVPRQEIVSIVFPENQDKKPEPAAKKAEPKVIDDSVEGATYTNRTGKFTLTIPQGWGKHSEIVAGDIVGAVGDQFHYVAVLHEDFDGNLQTYKGLVEVQKPTQLNEYQKLGETTDTIDGRPAIFLSFKGKSAAAKNLPMQFLVGLVRYEDNKFVQVLAWSIEPMFEDTRPKFESVIRSYKRLDPPAPVPAAKPKG